MASRGKGFTFMVEKFNKENTENFRVISLEKEEGELLH